MLFVCRICAGPGPATPGELSVLAAGWQPRQSLMRSETDTAWRTLALALPLNSPLPPDTEAISFSFTGCTPIWRRSISSLLIQNRPERTGRTRLFHINQDKVETCIEFMIGRFHIYHLYWKINMQTEVVFNKCLC